MLIMFRSFLPQYCCISDFADMIDILRSYEVDLTMAGHQVGGKFTLWQDLLRKFIQAKIPSIAMDASALCERYFFLIPIECCYTANQLLLLCAYFDFAQTQDLFWVRNSTFENRLNAIALLTPLGQTPMISPFQNPSYLPVNG
jgi:hypothetical protein